MTTAWYYDHYEPGAFPNQQKLCKAVEWTKCNLEGRRIVPTTMSSGTEKEYNTITLTEIPINPLTLRLRALQKAKHQLEKEINHINAVIKEMTNEQLDKSKFFVMEGSFHGEDSSLDTGGAPIIEISFPENKTIRFRYDMVYFALYDIFTNFGSVLDRLAYEVNLLYKLGDWEKERIDWHNLTSPRNRFLCCLNNKDKNLAEFIQARAINFKKMSVYRNRLIHDCIIPADINPVGFPRKYKVFLPRDPKNQKSERNVDAIEFCKKIKTDTLKLLDGSYVLILNHLKEYGNPPW